MTWFLYNVFLTLTSPIWVPWMWWRANRRAEKPNWQERTGNYEIPRRKDRKRIWVHAVSVGETIAARPVLQELKALLPEHEVVLTTTTSTGQGIANSLVGKLAAYAFYFPIDVVRFCVSAMTRVEPAVVVIMETELWLNFLTAAKMTNAKTCLVNGRISERSFARAKNLRWLYRAVFAKVDEALMQTEADAERARFLGAKNVRVMGNSKYDEASEPQPMDWPTILNLGDDKLIVVGSARGEMEEDLIIEALGRKDGDGISGGRVVFAPRHPERAEAVALRARAAGFEVGLRSSGDNRAQFLILDTMGELASLYPYADVAIIGGGFDRLGGQNLIQPMAAGAPVICGPNMKNFREPYEQGVEAGAVMTAATADELRVAVLKILDNENLRQKMAEAGRSLVNENTGASARYAKAIADLAQAFHDENL
ncbi:MAG: 3-deoxy-D-manno-octulosonic acid transferase [Armatimonadota bacterium]|nr:3-deoxy-D-manno-octulosonic acid transferase [Armatimonadota bacterium]